MARVRVPAKEIDYEATLNALEVLPTGKGLLDLELHVGPLTTSAFVDFTAAELTDLAQSLKTTEGRSPLEALHDALNPKPARRRSLLEFYRLGLKP